MREKRYFVGLILITRFPDGTKRALLRVRGELDPDTNGPAAYPGMCMLTLQTECEKGDQSHRPALAREFKRRLSFEECDPSYPDRLFSSLTLVRLSSFGNSDTHVTNYGAYVGFTDFLKNLKTTVFERGIRFVDESAVSGVKNVRDYNKRTGVTDTGVTAMFLDDKRALERVFTTAKIPDVPSED